NAPPVLDYFTVFSFFLQNLLKPTVSTVGGCQKTLSVQGRTSRFHGHPDVFRLYFCFRFSGRVLRKNLQDGLKTLTNTGFTLTINSHTFIIMVNLIKEDLLT
ncbi:hypothetical protein, partial [uncultured Dubosiella sp.]|uniref:hypothetical protein n=1 Tax=uncultured Dubosiella sp. TaxID=1937011 RepID=UPI0026279D0F